MSYQTIDYQVEGGIAEIRLNRPDAHNSVNSVMSRELPAVWQEFEADDSAVVAILSAAGEKIFCAGADLTDLPATDGEGREGSLEGFRWTSLQNEVWKPVISAVNGTTVGGGLHFVADSDIVIASDTATFFDTHVKVGLVAGLEPVCLARKIPMEAVLRMMLVGGNERMSAQRALELGLVGEVVPQDQLMARAREVAAMVKSNSPAAMARTKQAIWRGADVGLSQAMEQAWQLIMEQNQHPDLEEGGQAYLQRRSPQWRPYSELDK